jgi:hypothetical protein
MGHHADVLDALSARRRIGEYHGRRKNRHG